MLENNHSQMADIVQTFNMKDNHLLIKVLKKIFLFHFFYSNFIYMKIRYMKAQNKWKISIPYSETKQTHMK